MHSESYRNLRMRSKEMSLPFFLLMLFLNTRLCFACNGDNNCIMGFCIPLDSSGDQCVCFDGYEGEHCNISIIENRFNRGADNNSTCQCHNGGTCVSEEIIGEAAEYGECDNCTFTCECPVGFTGALCSETQGNTV